MMKETSQSVVKSALEDELISKIEPIVRTQGLELCDIEVASGGGVVRVFLEAKSGLKDPLGIDECEKVHKVLGPMFDVWDPIPGSYTLEVSTPGETPPLRLSRHFALVQGEQIQFETIRPYDMPAPMKPRKRWKVVLKSFDNSQGLLNVEDENGQFNVPINEIKSATWLRRWADQKQSKKKN